MSQKTKVAFGSESKIEEGLKTKKINAFDILCLDEKKIGWIDKDGNVVIVESGTDNIIPVDELPTENGNKKVIYIYNESAYIWNGEKCVPLVKVNVDDKVDKVDAKIENSLSMGRVEGSEVGTKSTALGDGVQAISSASTALGFATQSGAKGYYIKSIDTVNKKIYLSTEQVLFPEISEVDNTDDSINVEDYINSESKLFTIVNRIPYTNYIVEAVNNVITYQDDFEFTEIDTASSNTNDFSFIVNDMTDVGAVTFGMNNHAIGYGNKAYGENSNAEGKETVASGNGSHSEGRSTVASGNYSHTEGYQTKAIGLHSHTEGLKTITYETTN